MRTESDLHDYQHTAIEHIMTHTHCALFLEMGLGKTVSTLTALEKLLYQELDVGKVLVIAPKRVAESVWTSEIQEWAHISHLKIVKIAGNPKQRLAALNQKADIYTLGRDNVAWLCGQFGGSMVPFDTLVIDESSSFKNHKSQRFKALKLVQPHFKRVIELTGTPAPNGLIDLWAQIYLLDRGERLGKTISAYREDYFKPGKRNGAIVYNYDLQSDGEKRIHAKLADICVSMKLEDYVKLPGRIDNDIYIDLEPAIQKKYDDFEREQVMQIIQSDEPITAATATSLAIKLRQFANGAVYDADKNWHHIHDQKLHVLEEIMESAMGKPVLVAYSFVSDLHRIMEHFKAYKPVHLQKDQDIKDWNAGKIKMMVMHPASGGHGLNLQAGGNIVAWFGPDYSLELFQQFNARLLRQGQKSVVVVNRIIAKNTEDVNAVNSIKNKMTVQDGVMESLKAKLKKYAKYIK